MKIRLKVDSIILHVFDQDLNLSSLIKDYYLFVQYYTKYCVLFKKQHALRQRRSILTC